MLSPKLDTSENIAGCDILKNDSMASPYEARCLVCLVAAMKKIDTELKTPAQRLRDQVLSRAPLVHTVGHSTRSFDELLNLLRIHGVTYLADVRTVPRSRHNPQFNRETLASDLEMNNIGYEHMPSLGGLRKPRADSPNTRWGNASFRGFADYMLTPDFKAGLQRLIELARHEQLAIMCAEAVPWRCHRSLIGDALVVHGIQVEDIISEKRAALHVLTSWAHVNGTDLTYPSET